MSNITLNHLRMVQDAFRMIVYVHPEEATHGVIEQLRGVGYEVHLSEYMPKGRAFMRNAAKCGIIDLEKGEAFLSENTMLDWMKPPCPDFEFKWRPPNK